ncbi:MAG: ATP-binding protein [Clostridia bacterium]|nr:ATP-binding protein [Clostridia bacterium]
MYSNEIYNRVKEIIHNRRRAARGESERRCAELEALSPELAEIGRELRAVGPLILRTACEGGDVEAIKRRNTELNERRRALTVELGYPADYADVKYTCPRCQDSGAVDIYVCTCMKELLYTETIKASGIGRLIEKQTFESFRLDAIEDEKSRRRMSTVLDACRSFAEKFDTEFKGKNLLMLGKTGVGKTHMSSAIARRLIETGHSVIYDSVINIISAVEQEKFRPQTVSEPVMEKYLECDLLIMDDLGTEFNTQFSTSCLYNIITTRLNRGLSTVLSTNLSAEELATRYEARIFSRIVGGEYITLHFLGKDFRLLSKK